MFTLFYARLYNAMCEQISVYPNHHARNPYYRRSRVNTLDFAQAIQASYNARNARWSLPENIGIGSVFDRIAKEEAAEYEKQLVRLSPPAGPPLGKTLCQVFADEQPLQVCRRCRPHGGGGQVQYVFQPLSQWTESSKKL
jgi:hypothetical protein